VSAGSFGSPQIRDGDVVQVGNVLAGRRELGKPQPVRTDVVENITPRDVPRSRQSFAGRPVRNRSTVPLSNAAFAVSCRAR